MPKWFRLRNVNESDVSSIIFKIFLQKCVCSWNSQFLSFPWQTTSLCDYRERWVKWNRNDNSRFRLGNGGGDAKGSEKSASEESSLCKTYSRAVPAGEWPRGVPPLSRTAWGAYLKFRNVLLLGDHICWGCFCTVSSRMSGVLRHSSHLLLCSLCWVGHESSLDCLLFSTTYCYLSY